MFKTTKKVTPSGVFVVITTVFFCFLLYSNIEKENNIIGKEIFYDKKNYKN